MTAQHEAAIRELKRAAADAPSQEAIAELEQRLAERERELRHSEAQLDELRKEMDYIGEKLVSSSSPPPPLKTAAKNGLSIVNRPRNRLMRK